MRPTRPLALAVALSLALIAGCGDDEASPTLDPTTDTETTDTETTDTETTETTETETETTETTETTEATTDTTEATTGTTGTDADSAAAGDTDVVVEGFEFQPESITVEAGTEILFENRDGVPHTVTAGTPDEPMPSVVDEPLPAGATATWTVDETGTIPYFCEIHPTMRAEVVVQ